MARANVARERLALTPTLSRKRERETDLVPSARGAGRGSGVRRDGALVSWRYVILLLGRGR